MASSIRTVIDLYKMGNSFFLNKITTLDAEAASRRVSDATNPILWIAGHLLGTRVHLLELLEEKVEIPWLPLFREKFDPAADYPDMDTIKDAWVEVSDRLFEKIETVSEDTLSRPLEYDLPHGNNTIRGSVIFFAYHEAWHLGQIAFARKCMGMEGLVPY